MASIVLGTIVADIRGKVGSEVYSRNSAGLYVRSVPTWSQPDSQRQLDCRAVIAALSPYWSATLTQAHRNAWSTYAHQHPLNNVWGHPVITTGYLSFIRHNSLWYRENQTVKYPNPPASPPLFPMQVTITADASANTITMHTLPTIPWNLSGYFATYSFAGKQTNPGVTYFGAPWRYMGEYTIAAHDPSAHNKVWPYPSGPAVPPPQNWPVLAAGKRAHAYLVIQHYTYGAMSAKHQTTSLVVP